MGIFSRKPLTQKLDLNIVGPKDLTIITVPDVDVEAIKDIRNKLDAMVKSRKKNKFVVINRSVEVHVIKNAKRVEKP